MKPYVVGVDAGGTKTEAWAVVENGEVLARTVAGTGNPLTVGIDSAADAVVDARTAVCADGSTPAATCIGMAGVGRERERSAMAAALIDRGLPRGGWDYDVAGLFRNNPPAASGEALLDIDAAIALAACTCCKPGVVIISGTGSIAFAVDGRGQRLRAGGWGHLFDDAGSSYWIGREALAAVFRAHDGRGSPTVLTEMIREALASPDVEMLTSIVHAADNPKSAIAALAPLCSKAAAEGDEAGKHVVRSAAVELERMARAVVEAGAFGEESVRVALQGGAFANVNGLTEALSGQLAASGEIEVTRDAPLPPVVGAALLAMKLRRWDLEAAWQGLAAGR